MKAQSLPHSLDAERGLLGSCLFAPQVFARVEGLVTADDFYHPAHKLVFETLSEMDQRRQPVSAQTVIEYMGRRDALKLLRYQEEGGDGALFIRKLLGSVVTKEGVEHYAHVVAELANTRRLILTASKIVERGYQGGEFGAYLDEAQAAIFELAKPAQSPPMKLAAVGREELPRLESIGSAPGGMTGVPWGFWELDDMTAGLQAGDLIIVAARPSMGKTALILNVCVNAARIAQVPSLIFSIEMGRGQLYQRALVSETDGLSLNRVRAGLRGMDVGRARAASEFLDLPITIIDRGAPSLMEIRAETRRWTMKLPPNTRGSFLPPGMVVVDHLALVAGTGAKQERRYSREREVAEISRGLKLLAKDIGMPVVALSQLNRGPENRPGAKPSFRPKMSDIRESGAVEQDADLICLLYRDEYYHPDSSDKGIAEVIIGKQRNGPAGVRVKLRFEKDQVRFRSMSERPYRQE